MEVTPEEAQQALFGNVCSNPNPNPPEFIPMDIPMISNRGGGRKSTRVRTHSSRHRRRRHAQRGGALGTHSQTWAEEAERLMKADCPAANTTLRFYRLIIFVDIIHLLRLDQEQLDPDRCKKLVGIICKYLNNEDVLAAYLVAKFGSIYKVMFGLAGVARDLANRGAFPYFTRILTYIQTNETLANISTFAVTLVAGTLDVFGLDSSFDGIINWALMAYGLHVVVDNYRKGHRGEEDIIYDFLSKRRPTTPFAIIYGYVLKPLVISGIGTSYDFFSQFPDVTMRVISAASHYREQGVGAAISDATGAARGMCAAVTGPIIAKLVGWITTSQANPIILSQLGFTFEAIITEFDESPQRAVELKCAFIKQFANGGTKQEVADRTMLLNQLHALTMCSPAPQGAAASFGAALGNPTQGAAASFGAALGNPTHGAAASFVNPLGGVVRNSTDNANLRKPKGGVEKPDKGTGTGRKPSRWDQVGPRGGSSKHKKKHPRPTNKRKLLIKRVRRRRTTMKNKNKK